MAVWSSNWFTERVISQIIWLNDWLMWWVISWIIVWKEDYLFPLFRALGVDCDEYKSLWKDRYFISSGIYVKSNNISGFDKKSNNMCMYRYITISLSFMIEYPNHIRSYICLHLVKTTWYIFDNTHASNIVKFHKLFPHIK